MRASLGSDIKMPGVSGFGVLQALNLGHRDVPVVLMTALSHGPVSAVALELGAVGVLHKPFDPDDLLTAVCNARHVVDARRAGHGGVQPAGSDAALSTPDTR